MWKQFHTRYMQKAIISRCAGRRARPREKCRDTYSLRHRDVIDFNTVFHRSSQTTSKIPLVFTSKTKRKTSGHALAESSRHMCNLGPFVVNKYQKSAANSFGQREHDQGDKQRDTYRLKRRDAFAISSDFVVRCQKLLVGSYGLHEEGKSGYIQTEAARREQFWTNFRFFRAKNHH